MIKPMGPVDMGAGPAPCIPQPRVAWLGMQQRQSPAGDPGQPYQNRFMVVLEPGDGIFIQLEFLLQV